MYILGINAYYPDSSSCLIKDGQLIAAAEEERFVRIKHWAGFPRESIRYCLEEANIGIEDIDYISLNRDPMANFYKKIIFALRNNSFNGLFSDISGTRKIKNILSKEFSVPGKKIRSKVYNIEHHRAHLASSFLISPFPRAAIVSIDGCGDFSTCMVAKGEGNKIKVLYEVNYPHSLGFFYTAFTQFLGFNKFGDEYKVMGLSAYGSPKYLEKIQDLLILKPKGRFLLNLDYFSFDRKAPALEWNNSEPELPNIFSDRFVDKFGNPRRSEEELSLYYCDIAASFQKAYEQAFFHILNYTYKIIRLPNLCIAGGCALNSLANGKIFDNTPFKEVYMQPAPSDAGGSIGSAYYLYNELLRNKRTFVMKNACWNPAFSKVDTEDAINEKKDALCGYLIEKIEDNDMLCRKTAEFIAQGKIVGWFQGRMEWGPRALGNRSILVDPRNPEMKDILNSRVKMREWFRPFAPSILVEKVGDYFEKDYPDPFMLKVYPIKEEKRNLIPAVTHVDGTGRLQTVSKEENPLYWQLIKEFEKLTGVPVLLNTSFNENEPIVCKPQEALDCFLRTRMDVLTIGNYLIQK